MKTNTALKVPQTYTHGGGLALKNQTAEMELLRAVSSCLLWEKSFYETGSSLAKRIATLSTQVTPEFLAALAVYARSNLNLRHVSLWLAVQLIRHPDSAEVDVKNVVASVIQRADELAEIISLYWLDQPVKGVKHAPLAAQLKKGLAIAFQKFNEYNLAKYNRDGAVKLRDVLFLCHAKPIDYAQKKLWKRLVDNTLKTPDTWEVALSSGADKKETFTRLIKEEKLGALALLRNLRNMSEAGVADKVVANALATCNVGRLFPYRFIAAARHAPRFEDAIEKTMLRGLTESEQLPGHTVVVLDTSGSMGGTLGDKSEMTRIDAAAALAIQCREVCESVSIYATAGDDGSQIHATALLPNRHGFALADAFRQAPKTLGGGGIFLVQVMKYIAEREKDVTRVIVFTDEQDCDHKAKPETAMKLGEYNYLINVASYEPALAAVSGWQRIDGFSERVLDWIRAEESTDLNAVLETIQSTSSTKKAKSTKKTKSKSRN